MLQKKRSIRNSIERIDAYLQNKGYVALNQIALDLHLQFGSVKKCVDTLQKLDRVEIATNDKTTLIKAKNKLSDKNGNTIQ